MSDPRFPHPGMPGEIVEYDLSDAQGIQAYLSLLSAPQYANDRAGMLAPYMGGLLGGVGTDMAAMMNTPPAPRSPKCAYCGRRVVSLAGERDATCAGCGAAT